MPDDKTKSQGQDRQRINVHEDYELRDWAKSLNTTPERLKEAVQAVGDRADKVREFLGQREKARERRGQPRDGASASCRICWNRCGQAGGSAETIAVPLAA